MKVARYRCTRCETEWGVPMPFPAFRSVYGSLLTAGPEACPGCGSLYFEWVNFPGRKVES